MIIHNAHPPELYPSLHAANFLVLQFKHMITSMKVTVYISLFPALYDMPEDDITIHLMGSPTPLISEVAYLKPPLDYILIKRSEIALIDTPLDVKWTSTARNWYKFSNISQLLPCGWRTDTSVIMLCDASVETKLVT